MAVEESNLRYKQMLHLTAVAIEGRIEKTLYEMDIIPSDKPESYKLYERADEVEGYVYTVIRGNVLDAHIRWEDGSSQFICSSTFLERGL